jgi:hypothetical protein
MPPVSALSFRRVWRSAAAAATAALACLACALTLAPGAVALSPTSSYEVYFEPKTATDDGTGVFALSYNSPYSSVRHVVDATAPTARITFEAVPVIPRAATLHSWVWAPITNTSSLPSWLAYVGGWAESPAFALQFDGTAAVQSGVDPESFVLKLGGVVHYSHGPERYLEQEERLLYLTVHMHVRKTIAARASVITDSFLQGPEESGVFPFTTRSSTAVVPSFVIERGEVYNFDCGGSLGDLTKSCTLGTPDTATGASTPVWLGDGAMIVVRKGVLRVRAPLAAWGAVTVMSGATLLLDGGADHTPFSLMSDERVPTFVNHGQVYVNRGVLRLQGTAMLGAGTVFVAANGTLELAPRQEASFGDQPVGAATTGVVLDSRGRVNLVAGAVHFPRAIVSVGLGVVNVGMAGAALLAGRTQHVFGGVFTGTTTVGSAAGVNAVGAVVSGQLTVREGASLRAGAGLRLQGLGSLEALPGAAVIVDVSWYDAVLYPAAGIVATGPAAERPAPGVTLRGATLRLLKGGLAAGTGISVDGAAGSIDVGSEAFLHLTAPGAANVFGGAGVVNRGDFTLLAGASAEFTGPLTSTSHVRALQAGSQLAFSSPTVSTLSRPAGTRLATGLTAAGGAAAAAAAGLAVTPTHLFALFTPGVLLLRGGARVRLVATEPDGAAASSKERARFYAASVYNAGTLELAESAVLETAALLQSFEPVTLRAGAEAAFVPGTPTATGELAYPLPSVSPQSPLAAVAVVPADRYLYHDSGSNAGLITQTTVAAANYTQPPVTVARGALGGALGGTFAGPVVVGGSAYASPGAEQAIGEARVDSNGRFVGPLWARAVAAQSVGVLHARSLVVSPGGGVRVDVTGAGPAGVGYDQLVVDADCELGAGAVLNVTTSFEAFVRQAATTTNLRAVEQRRFAAAVGADGALPEGVSEANALVVQTREAAAAAVTQGSAAAVTQWVATTDTATAYESLRAVAKPGEGAPRGAEVLRVPILLAGAVKGKFDKINIVWRTEDGSRSGGSSTADDDMYTVLGTVQSLRTRNEADFAAMAAGSGSADKRVWDFALEYTDSAIVLVAWENSAMTSAAPVHSSSPLVWAFAAVGALTAAYLWGGAGKRTVVRVKYD